ncbi:hypothetical protein OROHE_006311 [Orobanche hederae]
MVACFRYAAIVVHSVHLPPPKLEFNYCKQEWIQSEYDEVHSSANLLFIEVLEVLHQMLHKVKKETGVEATLSSEQIEKLEWMLQKENKEFEESFWNLGKVIEYGPVYISSFKELVHGGARLLLPTSSADTVVPIYDDEPTSIISYTLVSTDYRNFMTEESEKQKDSLKSSSSLSILDSSNLPSLNYFDMSRKMKYTVMSKHLRGGKESKMDVLVMENFVSGRNITRLYDLKGCSRSRYNPDSSGSNKVLLDQNLIEAMPTSPIFLGTKAKRLLERAVWNDTSFFADGELDGDVAHRIKAGWLKWKSATRVLCDPGMPHRLKGKFYRMAIRPALLYGTECWAVKQCHVQKMNVAEMRMLRWMCGHTKKDRLRNEVIRKKVRVASIEEKMMENRLRWFGHVRRRPVDAPVRRLESWWTSNIVKGRGRPKKTCIKLIENDMRFLGIGESMAMERQIWRERIRVVDES